MQSSPPRKYRQLQPEDRVTLSNIFGVMVIAYY